MPSPAWSALVRGFDATLEQDYIVGGSIALIEGGRISARHDYGFADRAERKAVDSDTVFHWASITKTLNAISIMQLRDRGLLSLEDPITRHVPELRLMHNAFGSMEDITLRMLMTHSAGFQSATWPYKQGTDREPFEPTNWEQLVAVMPNQEIAFAPGSRFHYSNPAWIYLARTLESLTGDGWQDYIHRNVFAPLGMSRSYFGRTPHYLRPQRSRRYVVSDGADGTPTTTDYDGDFDPGVTIPNGGWNAPLADAAAYGAFLIGVTGDDAAVKSRYDAVLPRPTLQEMLQPQLATTFSTSHGVQDIGLGFFLTSIGSQRIAGHSGHQGGFASFLHFNPAIGRAVVAAFNTDDATADADTRKSFTAVKEQALRVLADAS